MRKRPIKERIELYLIAYPQAKRIAVHPDDYTDARKLLLDLPLYTLGARARQELADEI